ncbi:hypothetical protein [Pseudomonas jinjuensis]|uniref:Uncharacterized protein n=1 Tax=Pseudomonas jinjuensis TaxID=198616 RepID=A0A1H0F5Q0_9PSED|nr:hypothetical protein [Pseudomonas jinjuensis]SDN89902.1 hypothetical protein SAMN05216193_10663 [Pseudomonas jinjuensis]
MSTLGKRYNDRVQLLVVDILPTLAKEPRFAAAINLFESLTLVRYMAGQRQFLVLSAHSL